jgi:hypothetical protein
MWVISSIVALVFAVLAFIHFYWAIFGMTRPELVLPTTSTEEKVKLPGPIMTFLVGTGLLFFAMVFVNQMAQFRNFNWVDYLPIAIGVIFLVRAIGDFKYVGFFKSIKGTPFAKMDTKYYSPLCSLLALLITVLILFR